MNYEEKYKKALETVQEILDSGSDSIKMSRLRLRLQSVFPELRESENKRIKGAIIEHLRDNYLTEWASWLEKQGQKDPCEDCEYPTLNCHNFPCSKKQKYQGKSALEAAKEEKVEPRFKVDDFIVNNNSKDVYQVTEIRDDEYCLWPLYAEIMRYLRINDVDNEYHLWSLKRMVMCLSIITLLQK